MLKYIIALVLGFAILYDSYNMYHARVDGLHIANWIYKDNTLSKFILFIAVSFGVLYLPFYLSILDVIHPHSIGYIHRIYIMVATLFILTILFTFYHFRDNNTKPHVQYMLLRHVYLNLFTVVE